jgi:hypothetical protein
MLLTDKNLDHSLSKDPQYIQDVLTTRLLNDTKYEYLTQATTRQEIIKQKKRFQRIYKVLRHLAHYKPETTYFTRATTTKQLGQVRVPKIYGSCKVHKREIKPRPVISLMNSWGFWVFQFSVPLPPHVPGDLPYFFFRVVIQHFPVVWHCNQSK